MAQLTYSQNPAPGFAGGLLDLAPHSIVSRTNEETTPDALQFGAAAFQGSVPGDTVKAGYAGIPSDQFEGVVLNDLVTEANSPEGEVKLYPRTPVNVLRWGKAWVKVDPYVTIKYGDAVTVEDSGLFTNAAAGVPVKGVFIGANENGIAPAEFFNQAQV